MMKGYVWVLLLAMASMECVAGFDEGVNSYEAQDYQSALREFLPLANGGNASAQFYLGLMYYSGAGVPQNYSQAAVWYRKAADQGHSESLSHLGMGYEFGQFSAKNLVLAHIFYNLAAVSGDEKSRENRDRVTQQLTSAQLSEAQELASKWVQGKPLPTIAKTYASSKKRKQ